MCTLHTFFLLFSSKSFSFKCLERAAACSSLLPACSRSALDMLYLCNGSTRDGKNVKVGLFFLALFSKTSKNLCENSLFLLEKLDM